MQINNFYKRTTMNERVVSNQTRNQMNVAVAGLVLPVVMTEDSSDLNFIARASMRKARSIQEVTYGKALFLPCYRYKSNWSKYQAVA